MSCQSISIVCLIAILAISIQATTYLPDSCYMSQVQSQDCNWYINCLEQVYQCGKNGYPVGYGHKYCIKFSQLKSYPAVTLWVQLTTICLKEKLLPLLDNQKQIACHELKKKAFETHPICYDQAGFCHLFKELGIYDSTIFVKQLLQLYDLKDFQSAAAAKQIEIMVEKCFQQLFPKRQRIQFK